jgi:hypothetical protein
MNNKQEVIRRILTLPERFKSPRNQTFNNLLKDTGYIEISNQIQENDILEAIKNYPETVTSWLLWSEDKRVKSGWFLNENKGKYIVSFFPKIEGREVLETNDVYKACAHFITKEIETSIKLI